MNARNPDCEQGKHHACAGDAWDRLADERVRCTCGCHDPVDVSPFDPAVDAELTANALQVQR